MKNLALLQLLSFLLIMIALPGCEIIGDIFQAGVYVGIFIVVIIAALIIWVIRKFR